jgi:hypothetical protein
MATKEHKEHERACVEQRQGLESLIEEAIVSRGDAEDAETCKKKGRWGKGI